MGGPGLRFILEAGFLIALAVAAGLAELSPTTIVLVMGAAWLLVAVIEWLAWRESPRTIRIVREGAAPAPAEAPAADAAPRSRLRFWRRRRSEPEREPEPKPAGEDTQDLEPPMEPEPEATPVPVEERSGL